MKNIINELNKFSTATLHEAYNKKGALPYNIKPIDGKMKLCGIVFPVKLYNGSNYLLHKAIYNAPYNSIIVAETDGSFEYGYWGEIMTVAALGKNINGLVIDGCIRDSNEIINLDFPVFSRGICIRGVSKLKNADKKFFNHIEIGDVTIKSGDVIIGDSDGVVVLPADEAPNIIKNAIKREKEEKEYIKLIKTGTTTLELFQLTNTYDRD
jgi:4-hydroxy-4-methyl-2-oxoglutarate aldolase